MLKLLVILILASCSYLPERRPSSVNGLELVWSDEFNELDKSVWDFDTDYTRNNESQCYTNDREENVRIENGMLVLEARKEKFACEVPTIKGKVYDYTSGAIRTRKRGAGPVLKDMTFGRYEIRAKIPVARGVWPAIWMVGIAPGLQWPQAGEIDIIELVGFEHADGKYRLHSTLHKDPKGAPWPIKNPGINMGHIIDLDEPVDQDFHVYRLDWRPDRLEFFVDDVRVGWRILNNKPWRVQKHAAFLKSELKVKTPADWPYDRSIPGQQFFMILNLAIGGSWGGQKGIDDSMFNGKVEMLVDYVRIYKLDK